MVGPRGAEAEAVTTGGIDIECAGDAGAVHGCVVEDGVRHHGHYAVIGGGEDDGWWRLMAAHGVIVAPFLHQLLILYTLLAKEVDTRAHVTHRLVHRDDGFAAYESPISYMVVLFCPSVFKRPLDLSISRYLLICFSYTYNVLSHKSQFFKYVNNIILKLGKRRYRSKFI